MKRHLIALLLAAAPGALVAGEFTGAEDLVARRVPWLMDHVRFESLAGATGDAFELRTEEGNLVVRASTSSTAAAGLGWFLKYSCHRSMSHMGDNLSPVGALPGHAGPDRVLGAPQVCAQLLHLQLHHELLLMAGLGA
jgi:alpha-N-acetylglucosaminidase